MSNIQVEVFIFILAFLSTAFFTLFVRKVLKYADVKDNPIVTEHSHKAGTPTMGGLAILMGVLLIGCVYYTDKNLILTVMIMMTAGIVGLMDDLLGLKTKEIQKVIRNISPKPVEIGRLTLKNGENARVTTPKAKKDLESLLKNNLVEIIGEAPIKSEVKENEKILAQILVSLFLIASGAVGASVLGFNIGLLIIPVVICGIVGSINSVNLIDGMDGLAAGIIAIASVASAIFALSIWKYQWSRSFYSHCWSLLRFSCFQQISCQHIHGRYWFLRPWSRLYNSCISRGCYILCSDSHCSTNNFCYCEPTPQSTYH